VTALLVIENVKRWPLRVEEAEVVSARDYLVDPRWAGRRGLHVFNLCRTYGYQSTGYYVSLLATARGHRPLPSVATLQDLRLAPVLRIASEDLDEHIQRTLGRLQSQRFELSVYFGRNLAKRYDALSRALFNQFPAPFLRASFRREEERWRLHSIRLVATSEIPDSHRDFVLDQARAFFARGHRTPPRRTFRYDMAILADPEAPDAPSDERAIQRFVRAGRKVGIDAVQIDREDYGNIAAFDALFLRETTAVEHHTFRFARRAAAEGLVVVDDPESILRCTNKVFQAEVFARHGIPGPKTVIVHEGNVDAVADAVGLPCVLKRPDSSFSQGVVRVDDPAELRQRVEAFLRDSELVIAQEYAPSSFDWRIGVLGGRPLWACKYHMAPGHWQIVNGAEPESTRFGRVETLPIAAAPPRAVELARRASALMGSGLYGVDVKQLGRRFAVMEVNDNPNVDAGYEDAVLGEELYRAVMRHFRERLEGRGARGGAA
jgi:glutathione synthase/RimK-type ligase-like ATP-grasp enzyme